MRTFITSRRFLVPLLIVWVANTAYLAWKMWIPYKGDFQGKGLPAWVKTEWIWSMAAGSFVLPSFLAAFVVATAWYSHYRSKKDSTYRPFSPASVLIVSGIALLGFIYTSFCAPKMVERNRQLVSAIIFARSSAEFEKELKTPVILKDAKIMTVPQLLHARDSLALESKRYGPDDTLKRKQREINYQIASKIGLPILILLFYVMGTLSGITFRRTYVAFPVLIAYFVLFAGWYLGQEYFHRAYRREESGILMGANGMTLILWIIALGWLFLLRKFLFGRNKDITV